MPDPASALQEAVDHHEGIVEVASDAKGVAEGIPVLIETLCRHTVVEALSCGSRIRRALAATVGVPRSRRTAALRVHVKRNRSLAWGSADCGSASNSAGDARRSGPVGSRFSRTANELRRRRWGGSVAIRHYSTKDG